MTNKSFRSQTLLLELGASIGIFILAAVICLQVLLKAEDISHRAQKLQEAVHTVSSVAEVLRAADSKEATDTLTFPVPRDAQLLLFWEEGQWRIEYNYEGETLYALTVDPGYPQEVLP